MTNREREAKKWQCIVCKRKEADNFCGSWVKDESGKTPGRECGKPLCRACASIRGAVWLCPTHDPIYQQKYSKVKQSKEGRVDES